MDFGTGLSNGSLTLPDVESLTHQTSVTTELDFLRLEIKFLSHCRLCTKVSHDRTRLTSAGNKIP